MSNSKGEMGNTVARNPKDKEKSLVQISEEVVQTLQAKLESHTEHQKELEKKITELQSELRRKNVEYDKLNEELQNCKEQNEDLKTTNIRQEEELVTLRSSMRNLETKLDRVNHRAKLSETETKNLKEDISRIQKDKDGLEGKVDWLEKQVRDKDKQIATSEDAHRQESARLQSLQNHYDNRVQLSQDEADTFTKHRRQLEKDMKSLREENRSSQTRIEELETEVSDYRNQLAALQSDRENYLRELDQLKECRKADDTAQKRSGLEIEQLKRELSSMQLSSDAREKQLKEKHQEAMERAQKDFESNLRRMEERHAKEMDSMQSEMTDFIKALSDDQKVGLEKLNATVEGLTRSDNAASRFLQTAVETYKRNTRHRGYRHATDVEELDDDQ